MQDEQPFTHPARYQPRDINRDEHHQTLLLPSTASFLSHSPTMAFTNHGKGDQYYLTNIYILKLTFGVITGTTWEY
jgi:hypothetical protein